MRNFKFRAWDKFNENMTFSEDLCEFFDDYKKLKEGENNPILMQNTGFKDRHGQEIYEGDVCRWEHLDDFLVVDFLNGKWVLVHSPSKYDDLCFFSMSEVEVVGNFHETPGLVQST